MDSIQDVFTFTDDFRHANNLVIERCRPDEHNLGAFRENYSESWPAVNQSYDLFGVALKLEGYPRKREIWVGTLKDVVPSENYPGRFRFYVDKFRRVGVHDRAVVSDANFYGNGGGGGHRVLVRNKSTLTQKGSESDAPIGSMEERLRWVRVNHKIFRDKVWAHWTGKCAVYEIECNGLLIASHIYPWSLSSSEQKTDVDNGLLLSAPLDYLFDRGYISFDESGKILKKSGVDAETWAVFGLTESESATIAIRKQKITDRMKEYLRRHRQYHGFQT